MVPNPAKIKTVYSFVAATIMLDVSTPMGKAMVDQIHPFACQSLRQENPEFNRLYSQVERENTPHVLGTGMATSPEGFSGAFLDWLKSEGTIIKDADRKDKIYVFGGDAQNPQNGRSFAWCVLFYFLDGEIDLSETPEVPAVESQAGKTIESQTSAPKKSQRRWWEFWKE